MKNNYPKLHNATWPGIVGKGPDSEPPISLDTLLDLTVNAEVDGVKFDGIDLGLFEPHFNIDESDDGIKRFAEKVSKLNLNVGSLVAPIWGGPAMGSKEDRAVFVDMVKRSCRFGQKLKEYGVRPSGIIRIDSASKPEAWSTDPVNNTKLIAATFREACDVAADFGEKLAAEGEICWGGMHSWTAMIETLESVDRPNIGFQADMAHTLLYLLGYNSPQDRILPENFDWNDQATLDAGLKKLTEALRSKAQYDLSEQMELARVEIEKQLNTPLEISKGEYAYFKGNLMDFNISAIQLGPREIQIILDLYGNLSIKL